MSRRPRPVNSALCQERSRCSRRQPGYRHSYLVIQQAGLSRRRPGSEGEAPVSSRNTCSILMANEVSLIIPEWREQEVNNQNAKLFPTVHMVPLQNTKHCSTINGAVCASPHSFSQMFSSGHPKINTAHYP